MFRARLDQIINMKHELLIEPCGETSLGDFAAVQKSGAQH